MVNISININKMKTHLLH